MAKTQKSKFSHTGAFQAFGSIMSLNIPWAKVRQAQSQGARKRTLPMEAGEDMGTVIISE